MCAQKLSFDYAHTLHTVRIVHNAHSVHRSRVQKGKSCDCINFVRATDPPYNTGNDFVYKDNYKDSIANYKNIVSSTGKSNPETSGRFHTDWLNMMFPRLMLAHTLLKDDGVIFISIDDNEVNNLRKLCDEIFGEENFVTELIWRKKTGASDAK